MAQYVNSASDEDPVPPINSREIRILAEKFQCDRENYGRVGNVVEIKDGQNCGSLIDPCAILVKSKDARKAQIFVDKIADAINEDRDKQIMFKPAGQQTDTEPVTVAYMDNFAEKLRKNSAKSSRKSDVAFTILGALLGIFGGILVNFLLEHLDWT